MNVSQRLAHLVSRHINSSASYCSPDTESVTSRYGGQRFVRSSVYKNGIYRYVTLQRRTKLDTGGKSAHALNLPMAKPLLSLKCIVEYDAIFFKASFSQKT
jgi:hypothetical protein